MSTTKNAQSTGSLTLNYLDAHKPKIESEKNLWVGPNREVYVRSIFLIDEIISGKVSTTENASRKKLIFTPDTDACNIVAYLGDRGSGKTSGILSFLNWLGQSNRVDSIIAQKSLFDERDYQNLFNSKTSSSASEFVLIPPIDPSTFEDKERIIEVVIANMFQIFRNKIAGNSDNERRAEDYAELVTAFQKVHLALSVLRDGGNNLLRPGDYSESALENLEKLAIGAELKQKFSKLVDEFLKFIGNSKSTTDKQNSYLVITIDDADVHPNEPLLMLEDIRKYLRVPNLIIFMGVRFEQLLANVEKHYLNEYEIQLKNNDLFETPKEMTIKYLEKFLPINNRVVMPFNCLENIVSKQSAHYIDKKSQVHEADTIEQLVLNLTTNKTGILFNSFIYHDIHPLVPLSLRELHDYLNELSDYNDPKSSSDLRKNAERFLNYITNTWTPSYLPASFVRFVNDVNEIDSRFLHHLIVTKLWAVISNQVNLSNESKLDTIDTAHLQNLGPVAISQIFSRYHNYKNITLGDTIGILKLVRDYFDNKNINRLLFAIRTIVSIRILLDKISDKNLCSEYYGVAFSPELIKFFEPDGQADRYTSFDIENYDLILSDFFKEMEDAQSTSENIDAFLELNKYLIFSAKQPPSLIYERSVNEGLYDKKPSFFNQKQINTHYAHFSLLHYDNFSGNPKQNIERLNQIWKELKINEQDILKKNGISKNLLPVFSLEETENVIIEAVEELRRKRFEGEYKLMQRILSFQTVVITASNKCLSKISNEIVRNVLSEVIIDKKAIASDTQFKYINQVKPYTPTSTRSQNGDLRRTLSEFLQIFQTYLTSRHRDITYINTFHRFLEQISVLDTDAETKSSLSNSIEQILTSFKYQPRGGLKNMTANQRRRYANETINLINKYLKQ